MKNIFIISLLLILLVSCEKEETTDSDIPEWLQPRIEEIAKSDNCKWYFINRYSYKREYYYDIVNVGLNCISCEVYNSLGDLVNFRRDEKTDYLKNRVNRKTIWICPEFSTE